MVYYVNIFSHYNSFYLAKNTQFEKKCVILHPIARKKQRNKVIHK